MEMRLETLTPEKAATYLAKCNGHNRPLSNSHVSRLARAITNGEFEVTGDAIKFDADSNMIDGQHRCAGVVRANKSIRTYVARGLPKTIFTKLDQGKGRSLSDVMACDGVKHYTTVASATKWALALQQANTIGASSRFTNSELNEFRKANPEIHESVDFIVPFKDIAYSRGMFSALHFLFAQKSRLEADQFMSRVLGGESLTRDMIEYKLRTLLINDAKSNKQYRGDDICLLVIKAWNATRSGRAIKHLKISPGETRQEIK